jgi:hypothetical protein
MAGTLRSALRPPRSAGPVRGARPECCWHPSMAARWSAAVFLEDDKSFRRIIVFRDLWALKAILDGFQSATRQDFQLPTIVGKPSGDPRCHM